MQVDKSDVDKSFKDIQKQSQQTSDKVSKSSKKMNDNMVKDSKKATDKLSKQFESLSKQMTKALDSTKLGKQLNTTLSKLKTQISDTLGNINITANVKANSQQANAQQDSQIDLGNAVNMIGLEQMGNLISKELALIGGDLGEVFNKLPDQLEVDMKDTVSAVQPHVENMKQLIQDLSNTDFDLGIDPNDTKSILTGMLEDEKDALENFKKMPEHIKTVIENTKKQMEGLSGEELEQGFQRLDSLGKEYLNSVKQSEALVSQAEKNISDLKKALVFENLDSMIGDLDKVFSVWEQSSTKANAKPVIDQLTAMKQAFREAGISTEMFDNALYQWALMNEKGTKSTVGLKNALNQSRDAIKLTNIAYRDSVNVASQTISTNSRMAQSTNTVTQSQSKMQRAVQGLSQSYQTYAPKIQSYIDKIKNKTSQWLSSHNKASKGIQSANKKMASSFKSLLNAMMPFLSIYAVFNGIKTSINNAMDSIETDDKFGAVFGSQASEMSKWIDELNKKLGVSATQMKDWTSTLYSMGTNLGFTSQEAIGFSKDLSKLAQDMSSFYNIDPATAFEKLRGYMAGSTEVLYDYGVVATEANLSAFALSQGITKQYSAMSQAEKSMIRYQFAMQGLSQANDNLEITLKSPANQTRILKQRLEELSVALGRCFMPILTVVLPILNTFVSALTTTINAVANFISQVFALFGVQVDFGGVGGAVSDMATAIEGADVGSGGLADNLGSGAESAKEINKYLSGIDELNIVSTKQDSGSSSGSGSGGSGSGSGVGTGGIDTGAMDSALSQTETKFSQWVEKVANAMKSVWGALKDGWNSVGDYIDTSLANLKQSFANLGSSIESFLIGAWNNGGEELIYNIGRLGGAFTGLALDISGQVINAVANLFEYMNPERNDYTKKFIEAMNNALEAVTNFALSAGGWLQTFMSSGGQAFLNVMGDIAMLIGSTVVKAFANCVDWITKFMNSWAGQTILKIVALSLNVVAGAIKLVMISVEKLTPVWSALLLLIGAKKAYTVAVTSLTLLGKKLVDFGLTIASSIESLVVWIKNILTASISLTKNLVAGLVSATKNVLSFATSMLVNAGKALASFIISIASTVAGLLGLDGALIASTLSAGALKVALDLMGIGLIVTAVIALVTAVIKIGEKFNWWANISDWLGEKLGWVWDKIKGFFGWTGDNNVEEEFDNTSDSIEGMGTTFEETTNEIETTSDRFGTIASKVNQHFASIGFDAGKLSQDLDEAQAMMEEKFGMMSANAQEYLNALATGNQEVLTQMSADSETYTAEILYSYQKLSENEKNTFYETYGYIKGVNDDWLDYSNLTYSQLMAKHASYSANIMKREDLTAQEKDKLIDEHLTKVELAYEEELTTLKKQKKEILNNSKLSDTERQRLLEEVNAKIISKEQEKTGKVIDEIESVTDAQEKATKEQQKAVETATDAQVDGLKDVDKALSNTKKTLSSFKSESDKIANAIPKAWSGIGKKISQEFTSAKTSISTTMTSLLNTIQTNINKIKSSMSGMTTGISTDFTKSLNTLSNNINNKFKTMVSNIKSFATQMKNAMNFNFPTPYLKMPHLSVTGKWDFEKQQVPKFKVNWYSSGGIFTNRTLIGVGDANNGVGNNAEAVLPLDVLWDKLNNNFANQNKQLISALGNNNQPISLALYLDGDTLAKKQFKNFKELSRLGVLDFAELV
ncbi:hypothetical protein [Turicibacter sp. TJ11]|uniref:hypothetical protein n=1 Tax=Turicibacter sp. TJ11 TaxID=2806443 RepID=UPI001F24EB60|nr:hypothetical protein [Turicibacter sp. TJ11]